MYVALVLSILLKIRCHPLSTLVFPLAQEIPTAPLNQDFSIDAILFLQFSRSNQSVLLSSPHTNHVRLA